MKKIYIVILNYNGFADTKQCLKTISKLEDKSYKLSILIIDNGSESKELAMLKNFIKKYHLANLKLIENKKNLGFAKGNNIGIRYALNHGADFVLLLNNDTKIQMNFLKNLLTLDMPISSPIVKFREFKKHPKFIYDLGGFVNWWTGRTYHLNAHRETVDKYKSKKYLEVEYVAGCCMLVRSDVFEKIGFLDEKYFIYFEDVDFCISAKKKGFKVIVDPQGFVYHKLGGSMDRWSRRAIYRNLLGNFIFITKHLGWRRFIGYTYLLTLTSKILFDRTRGHICFLKVIYSL